ncbi:MAG: quinone oxidoreductase [Deltaproteobacteria bacterium]|nr:quinone oxidoreductase [Deltaproteobacteria bacterium]
MSRSVLVHAVGGPEVLRLETVDVPPPGPGELRLRQTFAGLNYIDVYYRTGVYKAPSLPFVAGQEGAGVVEALGPGVQGFAVGDRVAYAGPMGAYAQTRVLPADRAVKLPAEIPDDVAAAMMLKGMTAQYLLQQTFAVKPGDVVLFHAAAGGVGLIACQWAKALGATVIGTVGSDAKAALARAHGCDHTIVYGRENFVERVHEITGGKKASVVYDGVGKDTFDGSLDCLRPRGMMVLFGQSSGKVPPFDLGLLAAKGSLFITRPSLFAYTASRAELEACAKSLIDVVARKVVTIPIGARYALADVAQAHRDLEARQTTGASVLAV